MYLTPKQKIVKRLKDLRTEIENGKHSGNNDFIALDKILVLDLLADVLEQL